MGSPFLGLVLDSSPLIAAERRKLRPDEAIELIATVPVHPVTESTAEIIARIGGEQAAQGINFPWAISSLELPRWNSATLWAQVTSATSNVFPT